MSDEPGAAAREPRRLASILDGFPPGTPPSLDELELAMARDIERRCLAALDRALARLSDAHTSYPGLTGDTPPAPTDRLAVTQTSDMRM